MTITAPANTILNGRLATPHAVIYDRASTMLQKDNFSRVNAKEYGIRIAEQNEFTWEYVKEIGSGTTLTGRPELMKILDRIAAGEIQILIVQELDRLARPEEAVVYSTIRQVIMDYGVIIHTHTSRVDLNNDDDDFVADITMSVAKKERRRILKRARRGIEARAEAGKFLGTPGLGYTVTGHASNSDLEKKPDEVKTVQFIFDTLETTGGNLWKTAKLVNAAGFTGRRGGKFVAKTIKDIAGRKIYSGVLDSSATDKVVFRSDLQIVSVDQFKRVETMIENRESKRSGKGKRGRYIFSGFVVCGTCGGPVSAANHKKAGVLYQCTNGRNYADAGCSKPRTYSERLILPPVIDFVANLMFEQLTLFHSALHDAAAQYGKTETEEALEAAILGELESVKAGKQRIVEAIALGVMTNQEAATKLNELREKEQQLAIEMASVSERAAILEEWQQALKAVQDKNRDEIAKQVDDLAANKPVVFRRLLSLVFEPNSLQVSTERIVGNRWAGFLDGYTLNPAIAAEKEYIKRDKNLKIR